MRYCLIGILVLSPGAFATSVFTFEGRFAPPSLLGDERALANDLPWPDAHSVRIRSYSAGGQLLGQVVVPLDADNEFDGTVAAGDSYRLDLTDASGKPTDAGRAFASGSTGSDEWALVSGPADDLFDGEWYGFLESGDTLSVTGTLMPADGVSELSSVVAAFVYAEDRVFTVSATLTWDPSTTTAPLQLDVPLFPVPVDNYFVELHGIDTLGEIVDADFTGTASAPDAGTFSDGERGGGIILFQDAGGKPPPVPASDFKKKETESRVGCTTSLKKLGEDPEGATKPVNCFLCGHGGSEDGKRTKPNLITCGDANGTIAGSGKAAIVCQELDNDRKYRANGVPRHGPGLQLRGARTEGQHERGQERFGLQVVPDRQDHDNDPKAGRQDRGGRRKEVAGRRRQRPRR